MEEVSSLIVLWTILVMFGACFFVASRVLKGCGQVISLICLAFFSICALLVGIQIVRTIIAPLLSALG